MKNKTLLLSLGLVLGSMLVSASSGINFRPMINKAPEKKVTIHILHQEDYMDEKLLDVFMEKYPECTIIFDTTDTNETMYNELQTGKADYNLVCCSEYMIQRLASENLVHKINLSEDSAYKQNVSHFLTNPEGTGRIDTMKVVDYKTGEVKGTVSDYTAGYMWGTLGSIVNPYYKEYAKRGMTKDDIVDGLRGIDGWSKFWDPQYKGTHSIKESMRDSYALGIFEVFKDEFQDPNLTWAEKNKNFFNNHDKETIKQVKESLIDLKGNIFGFEVDSGKNDIVTGKIGMNLAWSGDAAFSILKGNFYPGPDEEYDEEKPEDKKTKLYYNIPKVGSNIWFDGFAMPKTTDPNSLEYEYTLKFIDFLSEPEQVVSNMFYTGFTSFMSGNGINDNPIVDFVKEEYDEGKDGEGVEPYDVSYFFNGCTKEDMTVYVNPDSYNGRKIVAQYPEASDIDHLYVMEDYGKDNGKIVQMWEDVKVNPLPVWVVVVLVSFVVILLTYLASFKLIKAYKVKKRKALRAKENN